MKTLYLECAMGAAGDMLLAALLELLPDQDKFLAEMNELGIPHVRVSRRKEFRCGIQGSSVVVHISGESESVHCEQHAGSSCLHVHRTLEDIESIIDKLAVSMQVKQDTYAVYRLVAEAESHVHGQPVSAVHFHELGALDAVADIVGVCLLMERLAPDIVLASPLHVGSGHVPCAHGLLPVPAPATAWLLQGIPSYGGNIQGELCTPTGAALLRYFVRSFGPQPLMTVQGIGYGLGSKGFPQANCVRAFWGEQAGTYGQDTVTEIVCNLDDMTGEALGFAQEILFENGALDVWTTSIQMKKGRPGFMLSCLCHPADAEKMADLMLRQTTTLGVRMRAWERRCLERFEQTAATLWGEVRIKTGRASGVAKTKAEYEDLARIAREHDLTLDTVRQGIRAAQK